MEEKIKNKKSIDKFTALLIHHAPWAIFVIYASGFCVWNLYLSRFGFFEYNLVQIRYLSAGLLLCVPILLALFTRTYFLNRIVRKWLIEFVKSSVIALVLVWLLVIFIFFNQIPQYFGGGAPIPTTIIGTPDQIAFLSNFGIRSAENGGRASVQTYPVCLVYQNDNYALFFSATNISTTT